MSHSENDRAPFAPDPDVSPYPSQRIPPHGDVSPDGTRAWPRPSLAAKIVVWGGVGLAAAAAVAGTGLLVQKIGGSPENGPAPRPARFSDLPQKEQARIRKLARRSQPRDARPGLERLAGSVAAITSAIEGFAMAASVARAAVDDFGAITDRIRNPDAAAPASQDKAGGANAGQSRPRSGPGV